MQGVVLHQPLHVAAGGRVVAARLGRGDAPLQQLRAEGAQAVALGQQPLVVEAGQEIAAVERDRLRDGLGRLSFPRPTLVRDGVDGGRGVGPPGQRRPLRGEARVGVGKGLAQGVQQVAQVGARLGIGRVGPEEVGQLRQRLRHARVQGQAGQEGLEARRVQVGDGAFPIHDPEPPQQVEV